MRLFLRIGIVSAILAATVVTLGAQQRAVESPQSFFGFAMGTEGKLAGWDEIVRYFHAVDDASDRVVVQELGKTTMGLPYIVAIVSSPDTIADLPRYQLMQRRLADPRQTTEAEALEIARTGKVVVLVGANVHANEIGSSQMVNDLLYRLAVERSPWVEHVLRNVILLLVPSQNPDGQQLVVDWHDRNAGTAYANSPLPELYHKYAGHDNNRDAYMQTQVETRLLSALMYKDWLPELYLDKHQMGSRGARIFVPPFKNPPNPNVDPLVWSQVNLLGQAMAAKLHEAGKPGVLWGELYTGFWQGANSTNPWWHNMVGLLTEVASARLASTVVQQPAEGVHEAETSGDDGDALGGDFVVLPAPSDVQYRMNYPRPWLGGTWRLADVLEYQQLATEGLLEAAANNREMLKRNFYVMNRRTIERFSHGAPFAYLVPPAQRDPSAATHLLRLLQAQAADVFRAEAAFEADGEPYPAGTYVIPLAQPFGRWVKDLLEPQRYPDIRWPFASAPIDRPYDVTAWTLGMLMDVKTVRVDRPFEVALVPAGEPIADPAGRLVGDGSLFVIDPRVNASAAAVNRLFGLGADVRRAVDDLEVADRLYPPGAFLVSGVSRDAVQEMAHDLHLDVVATDLVVPDATRVVPPRLAVFEPWGGNIDAGWTRWLLEQYEFLYLHLRPGDLRESNLIERFNVLIVPEMTAAEITRGLQGSNIRPEYRGGIGQDGLRELRRFVMDGGTLITLGNSAEFVIDALNVPVENVIPSGDGDAFFCPGSILRVDVDTRHPIGYGMPEQTDAMFVKNGGYLPVGPPQAASPTIVARYPHAPLLRSGWIVGESRLRGTGAILETTMGRGRVILQTFRVQNRAQTWGTFKLLFNAIFYGPAAAAAPVLDTIEQVVAAP